MIRDVLAPNPGPFTLQGTRSWLIGTSVMIDPGPMIDRHVDALLQAQPEVAHILVTHRHGDHAPASVPVAQRSGAQIFAPPGVLDDADVAGRLGDGWELEAEGLTIRAITTPGHTAEHVCFVTSSGDLFSGDMILGEGTTAIFPPDGDMGEYLASLERLRALSPTRIYPAHGPVRDDAIEWIDSYIHHRRLREEQILGVLRDGDAGIAVLREAIYPDLHPALCVAAEGQLLAHLLHMESDGRVDWDGSMAHKRRYD